MISLKNPHDHESDCPSSRNGPHRWVQGLRCHAHCDQWGQIGMDGLGDGQAAGGWVATLPSRPSSVDRL